MPCPAGPNVYLAESPLSQWGLTSEIPHASKNNKNTQSMLQDRSAELEVELYILLASHAQHLVDTCIRSCDAGCYLAVVIIESDECEPSRRDLEMEDTI
jgi:hypothetical protein